MRPSNATVTVDGNKFNALTAAVEFGNHQDHIGMPMMGSLACSMVVTIDMHDDQNMPFSTLSALYNLVNIVTRDKVKAMKIEFWKDDAQTDALCTYTFDGWISHFSTKAVTAITIP